ncbi:MAG: O-methyltransferase [Ignavibacteria bacterium]
MKGVPLNDKIYTYIIDTFVDEDDILKQIVADTEAKKIPLIQISPDNGKFLYMLIKMINAKRVLEIGALAGYSTIWMARALPSDGKVTTLEISEKHAEEARNNYKKAGLDGKIELIFGSAIESLGKLKDEKFDFVFIDADKENSSNYFDKVIGCMNKGGIIACDNTLKFGKVVDDNPDDSTKGILKYNEKVAKDPRVESMLISISDGLTISWVK